MVVLGAGFAGKGMTPRRVRDPGIGQRGAAMSREIAAHPRNGRVRTDAVRLEADERHEQSELKVHLGVLLTPPWERAAGTSGW